MIGALLRRVPFLASGWAAAAAVGKIPAACGPASSLFKAYLPLPMTLNTESAAVACFLGIRSSVKLKFHCKHAVNLQDSLVLVHGGMAQDVGPILEMVTEKYLLRSEKEWQARKLSIGILEEITSQLKHDDMRGLGGSLQRNFDGPIQTIIPWAGNLYTQMLIDRTRQEFRQ